MKNLIYCKLVILVFSFFLSFSINGQNVLESKNLNDFHSGNSEAKAGWPWNGCKEFDCTITTVIGIEIDITINHCCVEGVCAAESFINLVQGLLGEDKLKETIKDLKQITIEKSSKFLVNNYLVNIKEGTYNLNDSGQLQELIYEGVLAKK